MKKISLSTCLCSLFIGFLISVGGIFSQPKTEKNSEPNSKKEISPPNKVIPSQTKTNPEQQSTNPQVNSNSNSKKDQEEEFYEELSNRPLFNTPGRIALLGIIPGLGQAYLGNYRDSAVQAGLFAGILSARESLRARPDFIPGDERTVKFSIDDAVYAEVLYKYNLPYNNSVPYPPTFGETNYDRDRRLFKERQIGELNPLIRYGEYDRMNQTTFYYTQLGNPVLSTIFYSVYSTYRDAGGFKSNKRSETITDYAAAPFNYEVLKNPMTFAPIALIGLLAGVGALTPPDRVTLVPQSMRSDGSLVAGSFVSGISPAIGEEALFRGVINYNLTQSYGMAPGAIINGVIFSAAHAGNADFVQGFVSRALLGTYLGILHYQTGYDLRPSIAVHFWWNFIIGISQIHSYKADPNFEQTQRDVHIMPIQYVWRF